MNITRENIDELNLVLKMTFTQDDYAATVDNKLKEYRKKAQIPGFRAGMVPMGQIKKMYGKAVLAEEVNKLMSESLHNYLAKEQLPILGEPLPNMQNQKAMDFDTDTEFEFAFDLALAPTVDLDVLKSVQVPFYQIDVDASMVDAMVENHTRQHGAFQEVDSAEEGKENLRGTFVALDENGAVIADGHQADDVLVVLEVVKDQDLVAAIKGAKVGDSFTIDVAKSFPNESDRAAMLKIDRAELSQHGNNWQYTIAKIERFAPAVLDQDLFDKVLGEGTVSSEAEFRSFLAEEIRKNFGPASDYKMGLDARTAILEKLNLQLPSEFLQRWLRMANADNKELTEEVFQKEYPAFENQTKWQLVKDSFARANNIAVTEEDLLAEAIRGIEAQFAQYGMPAGSIPRESLENYARQILAKEEEGNRIHNNVYERLVVTALKDVLQLEPKLVSRDEFDALFQNSAVQED